MPDTVREVAVMKNHHAYKVELTKMHFEIEVESWKKLDSMIRQKYGRINKKSYVMRVLTQALIHNLIDFEKLEEQLNQMEQVIYI